MTPGNEDDLERGGDDMLAAEYVLGVLPADERETVAARIEAEPDFARLVEAWQESLSPLDVFYQDVQPPTSLKRALDARLFGAAETTPSSSKARPGLLQSLAFWRGLAAACVAALLLVVALPFLQTPPATPPAERLVASLASDESDVQYLVVYDSRTGEVGLSHVSGEPVTGRVFELWVAEGSGSPVSLGIIPTGANANLPVPPERQAVISPRAHFAISLEPEGGSPTGLPTGPVLAVGDLRSI
ncbi:anti-sigma factor [Mesorhizobium sp. CAU 1741]|uniref:anti-sigma factor n=1 Tax=Mesorhizobium sp. CAU 1741 TaxID=3140366 RepID=UPI00325AA795